MRGRKPIPTVLKVLRGNPGQRKLNDHEPQHASLSTDDPPELTDPVALAEWRRVAPLLSDARQVLVVDRAVLVGYCQKFGQWLALEEEAAKHAFIIKAPSGYPIPNPALCMANTAFGLMLKAAAELGITPSSRSRVSTRPPAPVVSKWAGALG